MQITVENSDYAVEYTAVNMDVAVSPQAEINVAVGDAARIDVGEALNYIKTGQAEVQEVVDSGTAAFNLNAQQKTIAFNNNASNKTTDFNNNASDKTTAFNNNATAKTGDFNDNATNKTNAFNQNATDKTDAFNLNAGNKTTDFNDNYTVKKGLIDAEVATASGYAATAKQWAIGDPSEPVGNSAKYWADEAATTVSTRANVDLSNLSATGEAKFDAKQDVISDLATIRSGAALGATAVQPADLATVATTGAYSDLSGTPTIPAVNNATLTITQGGVSKGTFTANASSDVSIDLDAGGGSSYTAGTGIDITSDVISVEGVKDQQNTLTAIKTWTGTRAQYDAIVTKDSNTLYNITDDSNMAVSLLQSIYPVGSIYIGTMSTCPLAGLFGTWTLVASDRVLQGSGINSAGSTVEAGLPNITGYFNLIEGHTRYIGMNASAGCVYGDASGTITYPNGGGDVTGNYPRLIHIDASRSSSVYGQSSTVQPPAYVVNIWERTA